MSFEGQFQHFPAFTKGVFDSLNNIETESGFTPDTRNTRFLTNYCSKRAGMTQVGGVVQASTRIFGGRQTRFITHGLREAVTTAAGRFYVNASGTWTNRTGALTLTTTANSRSHFCDFNDLMLGTDNENTPFQWDGDTTAVATALAGTPPERAKFITAYGNRAVAINFRENGGTERYDGFCWSALNNPGSWATTTNLLRVQQAGGLPIQGFGFLGDRMVLLFEKNIFDVYQTGNSLAPFGALPMLDGHGTLAGHAVVTHDGNVYFLDSDGPYSIGAAGTPRWLGEPIRETWATVDYSKAPRFSGVYSQKEKLIKWGVWTTNASTQADLTLCYRPDTDKWTIDDTQAPDVAFQYINSLGQKTTAFAGTDRVFEADRGTTDLSPTNGSAVNIPWYIWSMWLDMREGGSNSFERKQWFELLLFFLQQTQATMTVAYQLALSPGTRASSTLSLITGDVGLWDTGTWDGSLWGGSDNDQAQARMQLEGDSNFIRFKFSNTSIYPVTFEGYAVAFKRSSSL